MNSSPFSFGGLLLLLAFTSTEFALNNLWSCDAAPDEVIRAKAMDLAKFGSSPFLKDQLSYAEYTELVNWSKSGLVGVERNAGQKWEGMIAQFESVFNKLSQLLDKLNDKLKLDALVAELSEKHKEECKVLDMEALGRLFENLDSPDALSQLLEQSNLGMVHQEGREHLKCLLEKELEHGDASRKRLAPQISHVRSELERVVSYKLDMGSNGAGWAMAPGSLFNLFSLMDEKSGLPKEKRDKLSNIYEFSLAPIASDEQEDDAFGQIYHDYDKQRVDLDVTMVGASLAGLVGALEHLRRGMRVTLVEMRPSYERSYYLELRPRLTYRLRWFLGPHFNSLFLDSRGPLGPNLKGVYNDMNYGGWAQIGVLEDALMNRMVELAKHMEMAEKAKDAASKPPLQILRPVSFERVDVINNRFVAVLKMVGIQEGGKMFISHETNVIVCANGRNDPNCRDRHKGHQVDVTRDGDIFANATMIKGQALVEFQGINKGEQLDLKWNWNDVHLQAEKFGDWLSEESKCLAEEERRRYGDNEHFAKLVVYGLLAKKSDPDEFEVDANSGQYTWYKYKVKGEWVVMGEGTFPITAMLYDRGILSEEKLNLAFIMLNRPWFLYKKSEMSGLNPSELAEVEGMPGLSELFNRPTKAQADLPRITHVFAALLKRYRREERLHRRKGDPESIARAKECRAEWGQFARKAYRALFKKFIPEFYRDSHDRYHLNLEQDGKLPEGIAADKLNFNPKDGTSISPIFQHNLKSVPAGRGAAYFEWRAAPTNPCLLLYSLGINGANAHFSASLSAEMASMEAEWMAQLVRRAAGGVYRNPMMLNMEKDCNVIAMNELVKSLNEKWQHAGELILRRGGISAQSVKKLDLEEDAVKFLRARREMCEAVNDAMAKEGGQLRIGDFLVKVSKDGGVPVTPEDPSFRIHVQHITSGGDGKSMEFEAMVTSYGEVGVVGKPNYGDPIYEANPLKVEKGKEPTHSFGALWPTYLYLINRHIKQLR